MTPQSSYAETDTQGNGVRRGAFGRRSGHEGGALLNRSTALPHAPCEDTVRGGPSKPRKPVLPRHRICWHLHLGLLASEPSEIRLWSEPPICGAHATAPKRSETSTHGKVTQLCCSMAQVSTRSKMSRNPLLATRGWLKGPIKNDDPQCTLERGSSCIHGAG